MDRKKIGHLMIRSLPYLLSVFIIGFVNYTYSVCRLLEAYGDRNLVTISTPQRILYRMLKAIHFPIWMR